MVGERSITIIKILSNIRQEKNLVYLMRLLVFMMGIILSLLTFFNCVAFIAWCIGAALQCPCSVNQH